VSIGGKKRETFLSRENFRQRQPKKKESPPNRTEDEKNKVSAEKRGRKDHAMVKEDL